MAIHNQDIISWASQVKPQIVITYLSYRDADSIMSFSTTFLMIFLGTRHCGLPFISNLTFKHFTVCTILGLSLSSWVSILGSMSSTSSMHSHINNTYTPCCKRIQAPYLFILPALHHSLCLSSTASGSKCHHICSYLVYTWSSME